MRHLKAGKRLGITTSHRKALMRNLVTALLEHGEIKTTITKAKEMRKYFDKMIGLGKRSDLHARRQAMAFIKSKEAVRRLFDEYGSLYANRNGGYTRIFRIGHRLGDNAQMALIQMVDLNEEGLKEDKESTDAIATIKDELQNQEKDTQQINEEKSTAAEKQQEVYAVEEEVKETKAVEEEVKETKAVTEKVKKAEEVEESTKSSAKPDAQDKKK